jgi:pimeloyl-ACP methyl ester carboxylesterase
MKMTLPPRVKAYRIILFDQRGCGRSKPHAELTENTTWVRCPLRSLPLENAFARTVSPL